MGLTDDQIKMAAEIGARAGTRQYRLHEHEAKQSAYQRKLRNTQLVLKYYRYLEDHVKIGLPKLTEDDLHATDWIEPWQLSIQSVIGYQTRSKLMITHVDNALKQYKEDCQLSTDAKVSRRYSVIDSLYLQRQPQSYEQLGARFDVNRRTITRDVKAAVRDLSILLWGLDAIDDLSSK